MTCRSSHRLPDFYSNPTHPGTRRETSYIAHIALAETGMATEEGWRALEPGMSITAEIKTGQRRVISYLLSPLIRYEHGAMRER